MLARQCLTQPTRTGLPWCRGSRPAWPTSSGSALLIGVQEPWTLAVAGGCHLAALLPIAFLRSRSAAARRRWRCRSCSRCRWSARCWRCWRSSTARATGNLDLGPRRSRRRYGGAESAAADFGRLAAALPELRGAVGGHGRGAARDHRDAGPARRRGRGGAAALGAGRIRSRPGGRRGAGARGDDRLVRRAAGGLPRRARGRARRGRPRRARRRPRCRRPRPRSRRPSSSRTPSTSASPIPALVPALASEAREDFALAAADAAQRRRRRDRPRAARARRAAPRHRARLHRRRAARRRRPDARQTLLALREEALLASHALPWEGPSALASYHVRAHSHARRPPPLTARRRLGCRRFRQRAARSRSARCRSRAPPPRERCAVAEADGAALARRSGSRDDPRTAAVRPTSACWSRGRTRSSRAAFRRGCTTSSCGHPELTLRGAVRRLVSRARTASRASSCPPTSSALHRVFCQEAALAAARRGRAGRRCASRSARCATAMDARAGVVAGAGRPSSACTSRARRAPTCSPRSPPTI